MIWGVRLVVDMEKLKGKRSWSVEKCGNERKGEKKCKRVGMEGWRKTRKKEMKERESDAKEMKRSKGKERKREVGTHRQRDRVRWKMYT